MLIVGDYLMTLTLDVVHQTKREEGADGAPGAGPVAAAAGAEPAPRLLPPTLSANAPCPLSSSPSAL